ncbi:hypothetical protein NR800_04735 [Corallococcus interemptor]|uniref:hypothetical protein n=1 Tax=Corallococcus interemptor TaxID=2316720 RepID=UPI0035D3DDC0
MNASFSPVARFFSTTQFTKRAGVTPASPSCVSRDPSPVFSNLLLRQEMAMELRAASRSSPGRKCA